MPTLTMGQFPGSLDDIKSGRGTPSSSIQDSLLNSLPDSIILQYFKLSDITKNYSLIDTSLDNFFHQYDPVKRRAFDYQNLGNAGSASRPQLFEINPFVGFHTGLRQYDIYNLKLEDFRFFENNVPHSDVSFTPVSDQDNFIVKSDFSRSFDDGTSISLNYNRIRQEGFYENQQTKTTNFGTAIRYKSKNERYTGFLSFISNVNEEANNGGVQIDSFLINDVLSDRQTVPFRTDDSETRHQEKSYALTNYYQLNNPKNPFLKLLLRYDLSYTQSKFKFADEDLTSPFDTLEYQQYLTETRGVRFFNQINKFSNGLYTYLNKEDGIDARIGLIYDRYTINEQNIKSTFNNLFIDFNGNIPIGGGLSLNTIGQIGIGEGIGDFLVKSSLDLHLAKWINLEGGASFFRHTPEYMSRSLVLNGLQFYKNDFVKPLGTEFFGNFNIPRLRLKGSFKQSVINNAIYYDDTALPVQFEDVFTSTALTIENNLRWRFLGVDNYLMLQTFSENIYNLPTVFSKHNLYGEFWLFDHVLFTRLGTEFRFWPTHTGSDYSPITGNFHQSDTALIFYPMTDVYVTGKLKSFRFFLRFENISNLFDNNIQFQVAHYPQFDFKFRFGISWLLLN